MNRKDTKTCTEHNAKKDVMCKRCKEFYCPKCVLEHLQTTHSVDYLTSLDAAVEILKGQIKERLEKYKKAKTVLRAERTELAKKISILNDNTELELIYNEAVKKIKENLDKVKKSKGILSKEFKAVDKKLEKMELTYEIRESNEKQIIESVKEGNNEDLIFEYNDKFEDDFEKMLKNIKTIAKADNKDNVADINVDEYIKNARNEALKSVYKSIKKRAQFIDDSKIKKSIEKKVEKVEKYREEVKQMQETVLKLKNIAEDINIQQNDAKMKLEKVQKILEENNKVYEEIKAKKYVRCEKCIGICCAKCSVNCEKCKKDSCLKCSNKCSHCECNMCVKCAQICLECNEIVCSDCIIKSTCINSSVISLGDLAKGIYAVCNPIDTCKKLCYYDFKEKKLKNLNIEVPRICRIIQISNRVFITGGEKESARVNNVSELLESSKLLVPKSPMLNARYGHSLVKISNNCFYAIGGFCIDRLKECEAYDIKMNKWNSIPSLNEQKNNVGCILIKSSTLYCFGGYTSKYVKTLERLEINSPAAKWEIVLLSENKAEDGFAAGLYQISNNEIIIFRGNDKTDAYIFDIKANTINEYPKIKMINDYFGGVPYRINDLIYTIGSQGHVHIVNPKKQEYSYIEFSKTQ